MHQPNRFRTLLLCSLAGLGPSLGAVQTASAADAGSVTVSYRDLNLSRHADVLILYRRLNNAAASVCMPVPHWELVRFAAYQRCVETVLDDAVRQVKSPELLALHRSSGLRGRG
jgi:UrcA family protein